MKKLITVVIAFFTLTVSFSQTKKEAAVAAKVEQLKNAMVNADSSMLALLADEQLSYGHSGGAVDNKKDFIAKITSGKSDFVSIELKDQTIALSGKVAVVRHKLNAVTNDNGKAGEVHLSVLLIWQKQHGEWKLLARQAVKLQQ